MSIKKTTKCTKRASTKKDSPATIVVKDCPDSFLRCSGCKESIGGGYFYTLVIVLNNILVFFAFLCHSIGSVLTHSDSMSVSFRVDHDFVTYTLPCKIG